MGAYYTYVAVLPETDSDGNKLTLADEVKLPEIFVQVGAMDIMLMTDDGMSGTCGENLTWKVEKTSEDTNHAEYTLTIEGSGAMEDYDFSYEMDTTIAPWEKFQKNITKINLPAGITEIGDNAFRNMVLTEINGLSTATALKRIGTASFRQATLPSGELHLPDSIETIENGAFSYCNVYSNTGTLELHLPENLKTIEEWAFYHTVFTGELIIPDGVESIGEFAFQGSYFTSLIIEGNPGKLESIPAFCFDSMSKLHTVTIGEGVETIDNNAFSNMANDTIIIIKLPNTLERIEDKAFYTVVGFYSGCQIELSDNVQYIGDQMIRCDGDRVKSLLFV